MRPDFGGEPLGEAIPLFALHSILLPHTDLGLQVFEQRYLSLVSHSLSNGHTFGVVMISRGREVGGPADSFGGRPPEPPRPHAVGTLAQISGYARLPDGRYLLEVEGTRRFRIEGPAKNGSYPTARVHFLPEPIGNFADARGASDEVARNLRLYRGRCGDADLPVHLPVDPVARSYVVASLLRVDPTEKQQLLEIASADERLRTELDILRREIALLDHLQSKRG